MKPGSVPKFWQNVHFGPSCWEWMGALSERGYGVSWRNGRKIGAHRAVWEMENGPINDSKIFVLHRCDNPRCVRIDHLFLGSHRDNMADMTSKNRQSRGDVHGAHWRRKTHCKNGHPFDEANTRLRSTARQKVHRKCRACARDYQRRRAEELGGEE